jgi:hypothetical protein
MLIMCKMLLCLRLFVFAYTAFELWLSQWASAYSSEADKTSKEVIERIHDTYFLVSVIDNDYR